MAQVAIGWALALSQKPGMPQVIPLPGAVTVERAKENSKVVLLDSQDMAHIDEILAKLPVKGHRVPTMLQPFSDN